MEPILTKKSGKTQIFFYPDCIKKVKDQKVIFEINVNDIESITYNIKFSFSDFIDVLCSRTAPSPETFPNSLIIKSKVKPKFFGLRIKKHEYEILRDNFNKAIGII